MLLRLDNTKKMHLKERGKNYILNSVLCHFPPLISIFFKHFIPIPLQNFFSLIHIFYHVY